MLNGYVAGSIFSGRLAILWRNGAPAPRTGPATLCLDFIAQLCHEVRQRAQRAALTSGVRQKS